MKKLLLVYNFFGWIFYTNLCLILLYSHNVFAESSTESKTNKILDYQQKERLKEEQAEEEFLEAEKFLSQPTIKDPYERLNRKIFRFNDLADHYLLEAVARSYRSILPKPVRKTIANFSTNLTLPISALNSFAQGKTDNGLANFSTFLINSTIGVFGLFDIAGKKGIAYRREDFGQTLGYYKINSGNFLMLPFLGPSSTRDLTGLLIDKSVDVFSFNALKIGGSYNFIDSKYRIISSSFSTINTREGLIEIIDSIRKDSLDPYSTVRSAYYQRRVVEIKN